MIKTLEDCVRSIYLHSVRKLYSYSEKRRNWGFRRKQRAFYSNILDRGDLCFDIGANNGARTDIFLSIGARVVCVEPQPQCVERLTNKYFTNKRVVIVPKGLSESPSIMPLSICQKAETLSTFSDKWKTGRFRDFKWDQTVNITMTTLDNLIDEFGIPKFCKIDVEGFEYPVLMGLTLPIPIVSFLLET